MKKLLIGLFIGLIATAYAANPVTFPINGGTGTSTKPTLNQILIGTSQGLYNLVSIFSFGFATSSPWLTSGTSVILATSTNNVGIGTSTPAYPLTVVGTSSLDSIISGNINGVIVVDGVKYPRTSVGINSALAVTRGTVFLPCATYTVTVNVPIKLNAGTDDRKRLTGDTRGCTIIDNQNTNGTNWIEVNGTVGTYAQEMEISNLRLTGVATGTGILANYMGTGEIYNIFVDSATSVGFYFEGASGTDVHDNRSSVAYDLGFYFGGSSNSMNIYSNDCIANGQNSTSTRRGCFYVNGTYNNTFTQNESNADYACYSLIGSRQTTVNDQYCENVVGTDGAVINNNSPADARNIVINNGYFYRDSGSGVNGINVKGTKGTEINNVYFEHGAVDWTYYIAVDATASTTSIMGDYNPTELATKFNILSPNVVLKTRYQNNETFSFSDTSTGSLNIIGNLSIGSSAVPVDRLQVQGNITPTITNLYSLGSSSLRWLNLFTNNLFSTTSILTNATSTNYFDFRGKITTFSNLGSNSAPRPSISTSSISGEIRGVGVAGGSTFDLNADDGFLRLSAGGGSSTSTQAFIDLSGFSGVSDMNKNIVLGIGAIQAMRILSNGNVGIGSSTPTALLTLAQGTTAAGGISFGDVNLYRSGVSTLTTNGNITPSTDVTYSLGTNAARWSNLFAQNIFASSSVMTNASTTGLTSTNFFTSTINATGQTTLATASATALTVSGQTVLNTSSTTVGTVTNLFTTNANLGNATATNFFATNASTTNLTLLGALYDTTNNAGTLGMVLQTTGTSSKWVATSTLGFSGIGNNTFTIFNGYIANATPTDNVGIGYLSGLQAKLDVNGSIRASSSVTNQGIGAITITRNSFATNTQYINFGNGQVVDALIGRASSSDDLNIGFFDGAIYRERARFKIGGSFDIGTTTPISALIYIQGSTTTSQDLITAASSTGSTIFNVLNTGFVGINLSSPTAPLQVSPVVTNSATQNYFKVNGDSNGTIVNIGSISNVNFTGVTFDVAGVENWRLGRGFGYNTSNDISFKNSNKTNPVLTLKDTSGNVLIGTSTATSSLFVQAAATITPFTIASSTGTTLFQILANGNTGIGTTTPSQLLTVVSTSSLRDTIPETTNTYSLGASTTRWASLWSGIVNIGTSTWSLGQIGTRFGIFPQAQLGGTEAFSILSDGKVGIGSTTPSDLLTVQGSINVTGSVKVNGVPLSAGSGLSSLNGQTGSTQTFATTTTGTDFSVTSTGDTHTFAMPSASASARGLLSSSDWSTFNNKVSNAYASSTFLPLASSSLFYLASNPSGYISSNQSITLSGDISGSGTTAITTTIGALKVVGTMIANATIDLATKVTGVLAISNGGTGTSTAPTFGKILMGNASGSYDLVATSSLGISGGGGSLSGGSTGLLALWSSASSLTTSLFMDNGTVTGVGATSSTERFNVASTTGNIMFGIGTNGQLTLATTTATTSLETGILGQVKISALTYAGRDVLATKIASSSSSGIQAALWDKAITVWFPGATNGTLLGSSITALTTGAAIAPTLEKKFATLRRTRWSSVITTVNQQVGLRTDAQYFRSATSTNDGFFFKATFGTDANWTAGNRLFVGLSTCTTACLTGTTTLTNLANTVGFGVEGGTSQIVFLTNDGSGAIATTSISGLPAMTTLQGYDVYLYNPTNSDIIYWRIDNYNTGAMVAEGNVTTNLPARNTMMTAQVACSNGLNTAANACQIGLANLYIEQGK